VGGLLGGLDVEERSHLAPDYPVSFSLVVLATREEAIKKGHDGWRLGHRVNQAGA
jgi:hypothetical protein